MISDKLSFFLFLKEEDRKMVLYTSGNREDFIGENLLSEGQ